MITNTKPAQFPLCQGVKPAPGLRSQVCPAPLGTGNNPVPKVTALAGTASKAAARLCLSESVGLGSQNKPKLTGAQMPSSVKTGTFWACAKREHLVSGKLVKTWGVFSVYSWYSSYSAIQSRDFYSGFKNIHKPLEVKAGTLFICFIGRVMSLTGALWMMSVLPGEGREVVQGVQLEQLLFQSRDT